MFFTSLDTCQKSRGSDTKLPMQNSFPAWINHTVPCIYSSIDSFNKWCDYQNVP